MATGKSLPLFEPSTRLSSAPMAPAVWPRHAPSSFHLLAKPTGALCNLDCDYCFYLEKSARYPESEFRMPEDVLDQYVRQVLESSRTPELQLSWQGGEPTLMGLSFFERAMQRVSAYQRPGQTITHTLQTNGVLLDERWCTFFRDHGFLIGLSLDGPADLHDRFRKNKGGEPSFAKVMRAAALLQKQGVPYNILCSVHAGNEHEPLRVYRFLRDEVKADFIQFIPIVNVAAIDDSLREGASEQRDAPTEHHPPFAAHAASYATPESVSPSGWGTFLTTIYDEWVRRDVGNVFVQIFESSLASWLGLDAPMCIFSETCGDALALEHNGDVYSCDHFVDDEHKLGNILEEHLLRLVAKPAQRRFGQQKKSALATPCRTCEVLFACHGECPKNRIVPLPQSPAAHNYLCEGYYTYFRHIDPTMQVMATLLRDGKDPAQVRNLIRSLQRPARRAKRRSRSSRGERRTR